MNSSLSFATISLCYLSLWFLIHEIRDYSNCIILHLKDCIHSLTYPMVILDRCIVLTTVKSKNGSSAEKLHALCLLLKTAQVTFTIMFDYFQNPKPDIATLFSISGNKSTFHVGSSIMEPSLTPLSVSLPTCNS